MENIHNSTKFTNVSKLFIFFTSQEILLTLPRFTGSQEKNPALTHGFYTVICYIYYILHYNITTHTCCEGQKQLLEGLHIEHWV